MDVGPRQGAVRHQKLGDINIGIKWLSPEDFGEEGESSDPDRKILHCVIRQCRHLRVMDWVGGLCDPYGKTGYFPCL